MMRYFSIFILCVLCSCATDSRRQELIQLSIQARDAYLQKDWRTAGRYYLELTEQIPNDADVWYRLGNVYARLDQPSDAVSAYREALVRDSAHSRAWHNLAVMHLRQSAATLIEMQRHINMRDPMFDVSEKMIQSVFEVLGTTRPDTSRIVGSAEGDIDDRPINWEQLTEKKSGLYSQRNESEDEF